MAAGAAEYPNILVFLESADYFATLLRTSGMNAAIGAQLETGQTLLITDAKDSLSWRRSEQLRWSVGLYEAEDKSR